MEQPTASRCQIRQTIPEYECDFMGRLTMGGLLRLAQELSTLHCTRLGVTGEAYRRTHTAFLLAKLCAQVLEDIPAGEEVLLETQAAAPIHAMYHRYTTLTLASGRPAARIDARWVLVDTETRRILRRTPEELGLPLPQAPVPELPIDIPKPQGELIPAGEEAALYSRCDRNGHMNNTRYADIICDRLPAERFRTGPLRELSISYHRELPLGASLGLFLRQETPDRYYFLGKTGEQSRFEAVASF